MLGFLNKRPQKWLNRFPPQECEWLAVSMSRNQYLDYWPNLQLEARREQAELRLCLGSKKNETRFDLWVDKQHQKGALLAEKDKALGEILFYTHASFEAALDRLKTRVLQYASVTTPQLTDEGRALQWIEASMQVLLKAVAACESDASKVVTASFFIGKKASADAPLFRAVVFNLDITCAFDADGTMGVVIFDDKNLGQGSAQMPVLEARFAGLKPAVLDQLIKLCAQVMKSHEVHYFKG